MVSKILIASIAAVLSFFVIRHLLYMLESEINWYMRVTSQPIKAYPVKKDECVE